MIIMIKEFHVQTSSKNQFIDITDDVAEFVKGVEEGVVTVFIPHTTAAVTINENADPDVKRDLLWKFSRMSPEHEEYQHMEGNSDGHVIASMVGPSLQVIVKDGKLLLGTWQDIYFLEWDGPRNRKVIMQIKN